MRIDELPEEEEDRPGKVYGDLPIPPELSVGERLDGLEVLSVLSRTAQSRVYRVRDLRSGREMVMKAPSPELSTRNAYLEHFLLQQWVVERVHSPFVVKVMEPSRPRRFLYYLMAYVEGETLTAWARRHPQASLAQRLDIAVQMGKALQALHHRDLLHQQVHPDNVLIDKHGQVVLADFSACHLRDVDGHRRSRTLARQVGLTEHSAPEYALDDEVGRRSDQYSLASTVYWLFTGELPYSLPTKDLLRHTDLEQMTYRSARTLNPEVSPALDDTLRRACAQRPCGSGDSRNFCIPCESRPATRKERHRMAGRPVSRPCSGRAWRGSCCCCWCCPGCCARTRLRPEPKDRRFAAVSLKLEEKPLVPCRQFILSSSFQLLELEFRQLAFDAMLGELGDLRQAILEGREVLALDQRGKVATAFLGDAEAVLANEVPRHELLAVGHVGQRCSLYGPGIGSVTGALDGGHLGILSIQCQFHGLFADGIG